jgi:hypothetical protein
LVKRSEKLPSPYFRVDEVVVETGLYRVFHVGHRASHEVTLLKGTRFPRCAQCENDVHFELVNTVPEIERDEDFRSRQLFELPHPGEKQEEKKFA